MRKKAVKEDFRLCGAKCDTEVLPALPETGLRVYTNDSGVRNYLLFPRRVFRATWLSCYNTCLSKHDSLAALPQKPLILWVLVPQAHLLSRGSFTACWFDACLT